MTKQRPAVDPKCYDLAEDFLSEIPGAVEDDVWDLAKDIQTACDDACSAVEARNEVEKKDKP